MLITHQFIKSLLITCALASSTLILHADNIFWDGSVNDNWFNAGNWSTGMVPGVDDAAIIPSGVPNYPVISQGSVTIQRLKVNESATFVLAFEATLNIDGIGVNRDGIEVNGTFTSFGKVYINNTGLDGIEVSTSGVCYLYGDTFIGNAGTIGGDGIETSGLVEMDGLVDSDHTPTLSIDNTEQTGIYIEDGDFNVYETPNGLFDIASSIMIGSAGATSIGLDGMLVVGDLSVSAGDLIIQNTTQSGMYVGDQGVAGEINIGSGATVIIGSNSASSINGTGIWLTNGSSLVHSGQLAINGVQTDGMTIGITTAFHNHGLVVIGNIGEVGRYGILNGGEVFNEPNGIIRINNTGNFGCAIPAGATFDNAGVFKIGDIGTFDQPALVCTGQFINNSNGQLQITSGFYGIVVGCPSGSTCGVQNEGLIELGKDGDFTSHAVWIDNSAGAKFFTNSGCNARLEVYKKRLRDTPDVLENTGTILYASGSNLSEVALNNGVILEYNGTVNVGDGNSPIELDPALVDHYIWTDCGSNSSWNNPDNWSKAKIPTINDNVAITDYGSSISLLPTDTAIAADLLIEDNTLIVAGTLITLGDIEVGEGATILANAGEFSLGDDLILTGTIQNTATSTFKFTGFGTQFINPEIIEFNRLIIDKPTGEVLPQATSLDIYNTIQLINGNLRIPEGHTIDTRTVFLEPGTELINQGSLIVD